MSCIKKEIIYWVFLTLRVELKIINLFSRTRFCFRVFGGLRFRVLGASFSSFRVLRFQSRVLRFRDLGASFSRFGCFVFETWVLRASVFVFECFIFDTTI